MRYKEIQAKSCIINCVEPEHTGAKLTGDKLFIYVYYINMKVLKNSYCQNEFSFRSNMCVKMATNGKLAYKNTTYFCRNDLDWTKFAKFVESKFKNISKVNIFNFACSDGSESWSLAAVLIKQFRELSKKFFPIFASDIDFDMINKAKSNQCSARWEDIYEINKTLGHYSDYFEVNPNNDTEYNICVKPKANLKKEVEFKQADILDEVENLPEENNIVMCRNFWHYLTDEKSKILLGKIAQKLNSTSLIVLGELDRGWGFKELFEKHGFTETPVINVFQKNS